LPCLRNILNPHSVAVIGASDSVVKFGGRVMSFLIKHGFSGQIAPINPASEQICGLKAYAAIGAAPGPIDVALIALPARAVPAAIRECGEAGVRGCVILSADFAEAGDEGATRQREVVDIARRYGLRIIGPNCLGFINPGLRLALTSSVALAAEPMPAGGIGLISQSGSLMASLISHAQDTGAGFSVAVSVGNQADLEVCDFIEYFIDDPVTRAICVYVEGLKDGRRFLDLADRCRDAGKPLLVVNAGRSEAGARITQSHTASLAGSSEVWAAACRQHAIVLLDDPEALIYCAHFLIRFGPPSGNGVAALSPSGGTIAITADRLAAAHLRLADLSPTTSSALHDIVPTGRPLNPLDIGGLARERGLSAARRAYELLASDDDTAALLIVVATTPELDAKVRAWAELALAMGKPTAVLFPPGALVDRARSILRELQCPYTNRMDDALRVLNAAIGYGTALRAPRDAPIAPINPARVAEFGAPSSALTETEAKELLDTVSISTARAQIAMSEADAAVIAGAIGYPVVLKLSSRTITHKSDVGGVHLNLRDEQALRSAWHDVQSRGTALTSPEKLECAVQPMIVGGTEMIVGTKWDPQFGATVLVGAGGIWAETLRDSQVALAPVTTRQALDLLQRLRMWPLLAGSRGRGAADIDTLVEVVVRTSWLAATLGPRLQELDINPLLVKSRGEGAIALDARATLLPLQL
jgi:acetyl-CoA synthetase (ADP-forming)